MIAYFVRRLAEGVVALLAATFVLYHLLMYFPGGILEQTVTRYGGVNWTTHPAWEYKLYAPWPKSYLTWLFDQDDFQRDDYNDRSNYIPKGIDITIGNFRLRGSGILTGDLGESYAVARGQSDLQLMGERFWLYDTIIVGLTFLGMAFVVYQRIGHRPRYTPRTFPYTPYDKASLIFRYTRPS